MGVGSGDLGARDLDLIFTDGDGGFIRLADGDSVTLGAGAVSLAEDAQTADALLSSVDGVAGPNSACVTGGCWFVNELVSHQPASEEVGVGS